MSSNFESLNSLLFRNSTIVDIRCRPSITNLSPDSKIKAYTHTKYLFRIFVLLNYDILFGWSDKIEVHD